MATVTIEGGDDLLIAEPSVATLEKLTRRFGIAHHPTITITITVALSWWAGPLEDKVLVPWREHHWDGKGDKRDVDTAIIRGIHAHCQGPGIVSARSIEDAEQYAERLRAAHVPAEAIHSRQRQAHRAKLLDALQRGGLRCLVHVALLSEGVDLPWLRWLGLRRRVMARVRFVQEVGRVLRVADGKAHADILDPYGLFSLHGIGHPAALGEPPTTDVDPVVEEFDPFPLYDLPRPEDGHLPPMMAVDALGAWVKALLRLLQVSSVYTPPPRKPAKVNQRRLSDSQRWALGRLRWAAKYMPSQHRRACSAVCQSPHRLRSGIAGELLDVLGSIAAAANSPGRRRWVWPDTLDVPELPARVLEAATMPFPKKQQNQTDLWR